MGVIEIKLTQGKKTLVCDCHYELVTEDSHKWYFSKGYAMRTIPVNGKRVTQLMHRLINGTDDGLDTDHVNRNKLDNRCSNLRSLSHRSNGMNRSKNKNNTSGYKGVSFDKQVKRWRATTGYGGKQKFLGYFNTPEDASKAYNKVMRAIRWV